VTVGRILYINTLAIRECDGRYLHNHCSDPEPDCGGLLGLAPASQWYKVRLCRIKTQEFAVFCGGSVRYQAGDIVLDGGLLHYCWTDLDALCGRLLGLMPDFHPYKVGLCRIKAQEVAVLCGDDLGSCPGNTLLDGGYLNNQWTDFDSLCGRLLDMTQASQWCTFSRDLYS